MFQVTNGRGAADAVRPAGRVGGRNELNINDEFQVSILSMKNTVLAYALMQF